MLEQTRLQYPAAAIDGPMRVGMVRASDAPDDKTTEVPKCFTTTTSIISVDLSSESLTLRPRDQYGSVRNGQLLLPNGSELSINIRLSSRLPYQFHEVIVTKIPISAA